MRDGHSFLAIELSGTMRETLSDTQRTISDTCTGVRTIPRRYLHLVLEDLGVCAPEVLEAAQLAAERVARQHRGFSVAVEGVRAHPAETPVMVVADIQGPGAERLAALRADLHTGLERYGFALEPGTWTPHVPLAAVDSVGDLGRIAALSFGRMRINKLTLIRRDLYDRRSPRFRSVWRVELADQPAAPDGAAEAAAREEIERSLNERLQRRAENEPGQRPKPRRRRRGAPQGEAP
jgi:2'-5' RNA ligase